MFANTDHKIYDGEKQQRRPSKHRGQVGWWCWSRYLHTYYAQSDKTRLNQGSLINTSSSYYYYYYYYLDPLLDGGYCRRDKLHLQTSIRSPVSATR